MKKIVIPLVLIGLVIVSAISFLTSKSSEQTKLMVLKEQFGKKAVQHVDHSQFLELKKKFTTPQQVTEACIVCHNGRAQEIMRSNHWNWEKAEYVKGRGIVYLGKKNAINNFCIGTEGNEMSCAKCHVGYGMSSSKDFNYQDESNIDCLVCHDNSETYAKAQEKGGAPDPSVDLANVAQHVGKPKR